MDDVRDFIRDDLPDEAVLQEVSSLANSSARVGSGLKYVDDGKFWLKRWLRGGPVLLYVTLNSNAEDLGIYSDECSHTI
jgi:hypothetical protein